MFDSVRNSKLLVRVFLLLITLPFAFWGVESYVRDVGKTDEVATVGKTSISQAEFGQAVRAQQDRMRETLGGDFSPAMLDTPEARQAILDGLVTRRLLALEALDARIGVSDDQLREFIASIPALQVDGQFSQQRYEQLVRGEGLSTEGFEARLRQDLAVQQLAGAVTESGFVGRAAADRWLTVQTEEREVADAVLQPDAFLAQVKITPEQINAFYETNRKQFETPEQVRAEYLVLSQDDLMRQVSVSEEEIKAWYESHADRYRQAEERRASHILFPAAKDAPAAEQQAAKAKAEEVLRQVRQNPDDFSKLAKEHSKDPGSAENGGDLGFFGRGVMVKPFEDAAFSLPEGGISDLVQSDFGFHIIKVTGIKPEKGKALAEVRDEIADELKRQRAAQQFAESAEQFSNLVYEQADSLQPAAEKYKLQIQRSEWLSRTGGATGPLANEKLLTALFSEDAVKHRRNTAAVEVGSNVLVSARVVEHKPAALRPLEEVKREIETRLAAEEAAKLARQEGEAKLARLRKGEAADLAWSAPRKITRGGAPNLPPEAVRSIFQAPADKLPAYVSSPVPGGGYGLYKVTAVNRPAIKEDDPRLRAVRTQLSRLLADEDFNAYVAALRARRGVEVNSAALGAAER